MTRRTLVISALIAFGGCSGGDPAPKAPAPVADPATRTLAVGEKVMLVLDPEPDIHGKTKDDIFVMTPNGYDSVNVSAGTEARVVEDKGGDDPHHRVIVHVMDGPHQGATGQVGRHECKPL